MEALKDLYRQESTTPVLKQESRTPVLKQEITTPEFLFNSRQAIYILNFIYIFNIYIYYYNSSILPNLLFYITPIL
jgi:hypothetical protein